MILSYNGTQFTSSFLKEVFRIPRSSNVYRTTYNTNCNGQVELFNRTILAAVRNYVSDYPKHFNQLTESLAFACNTQVNRNSNLAPFELFISSMPQNLELDAEPDVLDTTTADVQFKWLNYFKLLITTERKVMDSKTWVKIALLPEGKNPKKSSENWIIRLCAKRKFRNNLERPQVGTKSIRAIYGHGHRR